MNKFDRNEWEKRISKMAFEISDKFNLGLKEIEFPAIMWEMGLAQVQDKRIKIKLEYYDSDDFDGTANSLKFEPVVPMEIYRTLAHELAHLKFPSHNEEFWRFNRDLALYIADTYKVRVKPEIALFDVARKGKDGVIS